jgi:hypothetical protein
MNYEADELDGVDGHQERLRSELLDRGEQTALGVGYRLGHHARKRIDLAVESLDLVLREALLSQSLRTGSAAGVWGHGH